MSSDLYAQLQNSLEEAVFEAFRRTIRAHSNEGLYCVALYTSSDYSYVYDTANTSKGLQDLVQRSLQAGKENDPQSAEHAYRWSPCDWPYHLENEELFHQPNFLLEEIWKTADACSDEDSDRAYLAIHDVFIAVSKKIRQSGIVPDDCLIALLAGDQSDESRVVNAEEINAPGLVAKFLPGFRPDAARLAQLRASRRDPINRHFRE
ncbi:MAG: DUF4303 domain-containing protein [Comamonadaceae bacterium]|nr:MAG: DUF4303 domain-containing protein [Comamonadaceae bacterium]